MAPRRKLVVRDKAPPPMATLVQGRLVPLSSYDAEELARFVDGTEFDLIARSRKSRPRERLYWKILAEVVKATDRWPTKDRLHGDIKLTLGYWRPAFDLHTSQWTKAPDSTAFDAMSDEEHRVFFDKAMALLAERIGIDPMDLLKDGGAR